MLLPVKDFRHAKARLAGALDPDQRAVLARWMADRVVTAASCDVFVVCDSDEVADWATGRGTQVLWTPGVGLNAAAALGARAVATAGFDHVIVAHSDLPLAGDVARVARPGVAVLAPDTRHDGTNVMALPTSVVADFAFAYGPGSFRTHVAEAERLGLAVLVETDERLALDVDTIDDLCHPLISSVVSEALPAWTPPTNPVSPR